MNLRVRGLFRFENLFLLLCAKFVFNNFKFSITIE